MDNSNIKVYLAISGALIVLLILIIVIPFTKQPNTDNRLPTTSPNAFPTSVDTGSRTNVSISSTPVPIKATFTGALDEPLPQSMIDNSNQKKDLQSKVPLNLTSFTIDFDYNEDKFVVNLKDPKDQSTKEFENWRTANYPALTSGQFILK